jgi:hypothetical protein
MVVPDTTLWQALRAAERAAIEHVKWLRSQGIPLDEAAQAIGLDPANCRGWDDVVAGYGQAQRDLFDQLDHTEDCRRMGEV